MKRVKATRFFIQFFCSLFIFCSFSASAAGLFGFFGDEDANEGPMEVTVNDAFINVYNGAGRGYPIFHVVERDEKITLLKMHTDWIKIRTERGITGWIKRNDVLLTLGPDGNKPDFPDMSKTEYLVDKFELGAAYGDFDGAKGFNLNLGYRFTKNLSAELRAAENTGEFSDSQILAVALVHQPFPEWRVSPYLSVGAGTIKTMPSSTLVQTEDRSDNVLQASLGAYVHVTGRFFLRFDVTNDYILTSRNANEEVKEWKAGFSVFF
ncbi:MAG: hypothetical protein EOO68_03845 [Moraxellaceae bacterium]|nr:MAG: hypothetical protein EOO68_03845 [Moraxellaceae bacterium]